jgi:Polyketide cyclase / dehydrase and lipid transport
MKLFIILALIIIALLAFAATRPDRFRIQRSIRIQAPIQKVFAQVNDFRLWQSWSPWEKKDPNMQRTHSGASAGVSAKYAWDGNKDVGNGQMEIIESSPHSLIRIKLDFFKPFEAHNTADFSFTQEGDSTVVTWAMYGPQPFFAKLMGLVFNMDKVVGTDFEQGLEALKLIAER